jgi:hypothetical protein
VREKVFKKRVGAGVRFLTNKKGSTGTRRRTKKMISGANEVLTGKEVTT